MSETKKHQIDINVRGYHLDVYGHVNNARYLEFLEEGRWAFFECNHSLEPFLQSDIAFVVVNININYRRPAYMNEVLTVETFISKVGSRSGTIKQVVSLSQTGAVVADAEVTFVLYDAKQDRAIAIEGDMRQLLEQLLVTTEAAQ